MPEMGHRRKTVRSWPGAGPSPVDVARSLPPVEPDAPMQWSLGPLGDLMWLRLPETRPFLAQQLISTIETALRNEWDLYLLPVDIVVECLWQPVMIPALEEFPRSKDRLGAQLEVVRDAYTANHRDAGTNDTLVDYVFYNLREPKYWKIVKEVDPETASLIESEFGE